MTLTHLTLVLVYTCVLTIKTCDLSPTVCSRFGFGDSAKGENVWALLYPQRCLCD